MVTSLAIGKVRKLVEDIDKSAFFVVHPISDASGGIIKRRLIH